MHTALTLTSLFLLLLGSTLLLHILKQAHAWSQRRLIQFTMLLLPLLNASQGLDGLHHFIWNLCLLIGAPIWDYPLGILLPMAMGLLVLISLGNGLVRAWVMMAVVTRKSMPASQTKQVQVDILAKVIGAPRTRLRLCPFSQPLAFATGIFRPTLVFSIWMYEHLDQQEREAVMAHELEHIARHDYLLGWGATILRDAFFYLPLSRAVYRHFQEEKELVCDELAVQATRKPLALASALTKVWLSTGQNPSLPFLSTVPSLTGSTLPIAQRIKRLLVPSPPEYAPLHHLVPLAPGSGWKMYLALGALIGVNILITVVLLGCAPLMNVTHELGKLLLSMTSVKALQIIAG